MSFEFESKKAYDPHHEKMLENHEEKILKMIENLINRREYKPIGKGDYGEVFSVGKQNATCLKFMSPDTLYPGLVQNSFLREANFQEEVSKIKFKGVKVPFPYWTASLTSEDGESLQIFAMQKMNAITVNDLFAGEGKLPENFDLEYFMDTLTKFINEMHNRNLYHRDLHFGNVMIDMETGDPVVIDFGKSTKASSSEDPYKNSIRPDGERNYQRDETSLKDLEKNLGSYLTNLKK